MNLLTKILNQRPEDPLSILESLNRTTQWEWFHPKLDTLRDDPELQVTYEMAEKQKALFVRSGSVEEEQEMEEEVVSGAGGVARSGTRSGPGLEVRERTAPRENTNDFDLGCVPCGRGQDQVTEGLER